MVVPEKERQGCNRIFINGGAQFSRVLDLLEKWRGQSFLLVYNCSKIGGAQAPLAP